MRKDCIHIYTAIVPIRWADIDEYGHVNHAQYFTLMQEARFQWVNQVTEKQGFPYQFPIIEIHATYKKALIFPGNVIIKLFSEPPMRKTWVFHHELYRVDAPETLYATAWIKSVCFDPNIKQTLNIPDEFAQLIYPNKN